MSIGEAPRDPFGSATGCELGSGRSAPCVQFAARSEHQPQITAQLRVDLRNGAQFQLVKSAQFQIEIDRAWVTCRVFSDDGSINSRSATVMKQLRVNGGAIMR